MTTSISLLPSEDPFRFLKIKHCFVSFFLSPSPLAFREQYLHQATFYMGWAAPVHVSRRGFMEATLCWIPRPSPHLCGRTHPRFYCWSLPYHSYHLPLLHIFQLLTSSCINFVSDSVTEDICTICWFKHSAEAGHAYTGTHTHTHSFQAECPHQRQREEQTK